MSRKSADKIKYLDSLSGRSFKSLGVDGIAMLSDSVAKMRLQGDSYVVISKKMDMSATMVRDFFAIHRPDYYQFRLCFAPHTMESVDDMIRTICSMLTDNYKFSEISKRVGFPIAGIRNFVADNDVERSITKAKVEELLDDLWSLADIADYYGIGLSKIKEYVIKNEIHVLTPDEKRKKAQPIMRIREFSAEEPEQKTASEINPQYEMGKDEYFTRQEVLDALQGARKDMEGNMTLVERFAIGELSEDEYRNMVSYTVKDTEIEREDGLWKLFLREIELLSKYQHGQGTIENFHGDTMCMFREVARPSREPDMIIHRGSTVDRYYFYRNHLIRGSRHWGYKLGTNDWALTTREGLILAGKAYDHMTDYGAIMYGKALYTDFVYKSHIVDGRLLTFENTAFGDAVLFENKAHLGKETAKGMIIKERLAF